MAKSSVLIELGGNPNNEDSFNILSNNTTSIFISFKTSPAFLFDVEIGFNVQNTTSNLENTISTSYNSLGEYLISRPTSSSILIKSTVNNTLFGANILDFPTGDITIINEVETTPIIVENYSMPSSHQVLGQCNKVNVRVESNININEYSINGGVRIPVTASNDITITLDRETEPTIEVFNTEQASEVSDSFSIRTLLKLSNLRNYVTWESNSLPNGYSLTILLDPNPPYPYFKDIGSAVYLYKLGTGNNWQLNTVFNELNSGLQDPLGFEEQSFSQGQICRADDQISTINIPVLEEPTNVKTPYFRISESNSLMFSYVQDYDNKTSYKNIFNSRSFEANTQIAETIIQEYENTDRVLTQFRSNYETSSVNAINENGDELDLPVQLLYQNIGLKDSRDGIFYNLDNGKIGLYFTSGNVYNYDSTIITGTYSLDGFLTEWGVIGNYAFIYELGEWLQIENIIYSDEKSADVLVFNYTYLGSELTSRVSSIYNREIYNVYTFGTGMFNFENDLFSVCIDNTDSREDWGNLSLISENIVVEELPKNYVELIYFNYENYSDMQYADTDFYNLLRLPYDLFYSGSDSDKEVEKTDNTAITQSTSNYHTKTLSLVGIAEKYMRKLTQAFSHKEIFIDRIQYTVEETEVSTVVGNTNTYDIEITLIAAENGFNPLLNRDFVGNIEITKKADFSNDFSSDFSI